MTRSPADEIIAAAGQPVAGHTLSVKEMEQAVKEQRVLTISYWSNFGQGEAGVYIADKFYFRDKDRIYPNYLVFPKPLLPALCEKCAGDWEKVTDVFAAFGVDPNG